MIFKKGNRERLVGDVVVGDHLGCSDHEIIEFSIIGETRRGSKKTSTLDFQRADSGLLKRLRELLGGQPLKIKESRKDRHALKQKVLKAQEQTRLSLCAER